MSLRLGVLARREVCPPSLRQAPSSLWNRALFWLLAPAPRDCSAPLAQNTKVREDFKACIEDLSVPGASELWDRIGQTCSLRDLWHLRTEVYRIVALELGQVEAEHRMEKLNRHFPTRSPRSGFAPL